MSIFLVFIVFLFCLQAQCSSKHYEHIPPSAIQKAEHNYNQLVLLSSKNDCFREVVNRLISSCKSMNHETQSKFALELTICHYNWSGKRGFRCPDSATFEECYQSLEGESWLTYIAFLNQAETSCFHYRSLLWQEESENTINTLMDSSKGVTLTLERAYEKTQEIYSLQTEVENWMKNSVELNQKTVDKLNQTSLNLDMMNHKLLGGFHDLVDNLKVRDKKVDNMFEVILRELSMIKKLQVLFVFGSFDFNSVLFYVLSFLVIRYSISYQKFSGASFFLYSAFLCNYIFELVTSRLLMTFSPNQEAEIMIQFHQLIWYERLVFVVACFYRLFYECKNYCDPSKVILSELAVIRQHIVVDTPTKKRNFKLQFLSMIEDSVGKLVFKHLHAPVERPQENLTRLNEIRKRLTFEER